MHLPSFRFTPMGPALALFLLLPAAHAAEVSPASQVDTTPGLTPEAVKRVFDQQRQTLVSCMRLFTEGGFQGDTPWNPGEVDDRILLTFSVGRDGKVQPDDLRGERFRVQGLYLEDGCAEPIVRSWTFPAFPARKGETVKVELRARFSTTAAERKAAIARIHEELDALCRALSALDKGKPPARKDTTQAIQRFLAERRSSMPPQVVFFVEALVNLNVEDQAMMHESGRSQFLAAPCPTVRGWIPPERRER